MWAQTTWVTADPGVAMAEFRRQAPAERTGEDTREFDRLVREAEAEEADLFARSRGLAARAKPRAASDRIGMRA